MLEQAVLFLPSIGRICLIGAKDVLVCSCSSVKIENETSQRAKCGHRLGFDGTTFTASASNFRSIAAKVLLRDHKKAIAFHIETAFFNYLFSVTLLFALAGSCSPDQQRPGADGAGDHRCPPGEAGEEGAAAGQQRRGKGCGAAVAGIQSDPSQWGLQ